MPSKPVAVVTGAYRGLGLEICRQLAQHGYTVVLTARREDVGRAAAERLEAEGLDVRFHPLDVTDEESIRRLAIHVETILGRLDVLVNNAGVFADPQPGSGSCSAFVAEADSIRHAFETNALAVLRLCQIMIPIMQGEGRVVNVSSTMGQLGEMSGCCPAYRLSKTALNALTRIFADELKGTDVKVNSVCPGWVRGETGGSEAELSVQEGAAGVVWAATLSADGPTGGFFRHGEPIPW